MVIYKVKVNANACQWVLPSDRTSTIQFSGRVISDLIPPTYYVHNPVMERSNFFIINPGVLCFDEATRNRERIDGIFERAGQILPIHLDTGEQLFILNVTECINAIDPSVVDRSVYWNEELKRQMPGSIKKYAFHSHRLSGSTIFKIPEEVTACPFTHSGWVAEEDDFYIMYRKSGLTGLQFEKVWEGDNPQIR